MRWSVLLGVLALSLCGRAADPILTFVYPAGGKPESEFEIEVGGVVLQDVAHAVVSGEGVKATLLGAARTVTYSKKGRPIPAVLPNRYRFKVVVEKEARPGIRALRIGSAYRLSEPVPFEIAALEEFSVALSNRSAAAESAVAGLPACLNGRVTGSAPNRHRFQAAKGMTLVAFTEARVLPRGGFRPVLTFTDGAGKPCENVAVYDADIAPVLVFEVPQDGAYALEVKSASGRVGDGCVYRVKLGELPLVTGFSPLGAKEGESLNVRLAGVNLEQKRVRLFTGGKNSALCLEALTEGALVLPELKFDLAEEADVDEKGPEGAAGGAQTLDLPCVVNGVIDQAGGADRYRFAGTAGSELYVDVRAEAVGSPLRPVVTVSDAQGRAVARGAFDTNGTVQACLQGRDPSVRVKLSEAGTYEIAVADLEGRSGERFAYRLRVGPPRPDFELRMRPASLCIPADGSALVSLYLRRIHGFDGEVRVGLDYPPLSIACEGGVIPAGATTGMMTVSTDGVRFPRTVFGLSLTGTAEIEGRAVKRAATPVVFDDRPEAAAVQAFGELAAKASAGLRALRVDTAAVKTPLAIPQQTPLRLPILSPTLAPAVGTKYEPILVWPPRGFVIESVQHTNKEDYVFFMVRADAKVMKAGEAGRLILGCKLAGATNRTVMAVTQSVPFVVK